MSENILDKAKASLNSTKGKLSELKENYFDDEKKEIIEQFKGSGQEKIKETLQTFNDYAALFKQSGYELSSINASVSIPPDVSISFKCLDYIPIDDRPGLLEQARENKIASIILKSLFKASDFAAAMKLGEFKLKSINVKLGLIPAISVSFS
jgi:hypothetical protein